MKKKQTASEMLEAAGYHLYIPDPTEGFAGTIYRAFERIRENKYARCTRLYMSSFGDVWATLDGEKVSLTAYELRAMARLLDEKEGLV